VENKQIKPEMETTDKRRWFEILAVILTGALKYVMMDWLGWRLFYISGAMLFWGVYIFLRYRKDPRILQLWGIRKRNFRRTFLFLLPFALVMVGLIAVYGFYVKANFLNWRIIPVLAIYPLWGIIQQFMMIALVAGNLQAIRSLRFRRSQVMVGTSLLFAMVHYPYLPLMIYAFLMEMVFIYTFFRWRNIWPLGLYHGWVSSLFLFFVSGRDLWKELWVIFR
jgi:hypothetical protein